MAIVGRNTWEECRIYKRPSSYCCAVVAVGIRYSDQIKPFFFSTQLNAVLPLSRAVRVAEGVGVCKRYFDWFLTEVRTFGQCIFLQLLLKLLTFAENNVKCVLIHSHMHLASCVQA